MTNHSTVRTKNKRKSYANIPLLKTRLLFISLSLAFIAIIVPFYAFFVYSLDWFLIAVAIVILVLANQIYFGFSSYLITLDKINEVLKAANKGEYHSRITNAKGLGEVGKVAWELNELFDILENYFK